MLKSRSRSATSAWSPSTLKTVYWCWTSVLIARPSPRSSSTSRLSASSSSPLATLSSGDGSSAHVAWARASQYSVYAVSTSRLSSGATVGKEVVSVIWAEGRLGGWGAGG